MRLQLESEELIEYFGTNELTYEFLDEFDEYDQRTICVDADFSSYEGYRAFMEIRRIQMYFPNLKNVGFCCNVTKGEDVKKVLEHLDADHSGKIDCDEFKILIREVLGALLED